MPDCLGYLGPPFVAEIEADEEADEEGDEREEEEDSGSRAEETLDGEPTKCEGSNYTEDEGEEDQRKWGTSSLLSDKLMDRRKSF